MLEDVLRNQDEGPVSDDTSTIEMSTDSGTTKVSANETICCLSLKVYEGRKEPPLFLGKHCDNIRDLDLDRVF